MWEFQLGGRVIEAKMQDEDWLERFRRQEFTLHPGDALRAIVRTEVARGFQGEAVATHYYVLHVLGVIEGTRGEQQNLL